ncbi:FG-GAP repeat domain-containing protein [Streptomyces sp. NPDC021012]|uniref:FG-GAP repeat domain-containing protein n=1 Tax=Streptomyces sp. NPDC021012 TaxID=3365107 RepID=UPI00378BB4E1
MANSSGLNRTGVLSRVTVAAITAALVGTTTAAVAADAPQTRSASSATVESSTRAGAFAASASTAAVTPVNSLFGEASNGDLYRYDPNGTGGLKAPVDGGGGWQYSKFIMQVDHNADGASDGLWFVENSRLGYMPFGGVPTDIGGGWGIYNKVFSASNTGGGTADDLFARDTSGVLWHYLGYGNGKLAPRYKVGSGWGAYNQITGKGDLTNDGKADIVARDGAGVLWLYKGTGNYKAPFSARTRIGSGWNTFNTLVSVGDLNNDGVADLVARDTAGALWLYKGTGNASAPFYAKVKIGTGGWNGFKMLF